MNDLEREYEDNLRRTRERETRRRAIAKGAAVALLLSANGAMLVVDGPTPRALVHSAIALGLIGVGVLVPAVARFDKWMRNRTVESATTERERVYRKSIPTSASGGTRARTMMVIGAILGCAVAAFSGYGSQSTPLAFDAAMFALLVAACAFAVGIKHISERWRAKRNARLRLEMERWLASADSCKVGPREWTK